MNAQALALFLKAVSMVETGGDPRAVGRHGERGEFAMTPAVVASCGGFGEHEAEKYARWLERQLVVAGVSPQPFNLALAWNAGAGAVLASRAPAASYDYALRVRNLFEQLNQQEAYAPVH